MNARTREYQPPPDSRRRGGLPTRPSVPLNGVRPGDVAFTFPLVGPSPLRPGFQFLTHSPEL